MPSALSLSVVARAFRPRRTIALPVLAMLALWPLAEATAHDFAAGDLVIEHPWSPATPAGATVAAGYMTIRNDGAEPDRLVSATAEIGGRVELHEMAVNDEGVMTMRPVPGALEIPAGGSVALERGSYHLMVMGLEEPTVEGESFAGTLTFEKAGAVDVEFHVEAMGGGHGGHGD